MLLLLHTYRGRATLASLVKPGILAAEAKGAKARATLIRRVGAAGVLALRTPEAARALNHHRRSRRGRRPSAQISKRRAPPRPTRQSTRSPKASVFTSPWPPPPDVLAQAEVILACDGRGLLAALAYVPARQGIAVPELELLLRADAVPVRRGVTRLAPGAPLAAPAPVAIFHQKAGCCGGESASGQPAGQSAEARRARRRRPGRAGAGRARRSRRSPWAARANQRRAQRAGRQHRLTQRALPCEERSARVVGVVERTVPRASAQGSATKRRDDNRPPAA